MLLNLNSFKAINGTLGRPAGDRLLQSAGERMQACVCEMDPVARLGADEFARIIAKAGLLDGAGRVADRIVMAFAAPFDLHVGGAVGSGAGQDELRRVMVDASIGIAMAPADAATADALLRWRHPTCGLVPPLDFIPLAEEAGLIVPIGEWVVREACRSAAQWPAEIGVTVNPFAMQSRSPSLVDVVEAALDLAGLKPGQLELEITGSVLLYDNPGTLAVLRALGIRIAMDDFGTGYSSLSYLHSFPFDKIKIDRMFGR